MTFTNDITARINDDFGENANEATIILIDAINKVDYLKTDRIIRCILFLSKGNLAELNKIIGAASIDTRDVMLWAEYEKLNGDFDYKRVRDFNNTFEESANNVEE